ncbi:MAG: hypothetical protein HYV27_22010 [Candidatus Hydrogenedentes bacterium]|nr:hypothetical protein [Candidatus Hydrogenedentota bacterium]
MGERDGVRFFARAPVRIDCSGGGSDAPPFCTEYGGHVVNFAINHYVYACVEPRWESEAVEITSHDLGESATAPNAQALEMGGMLNLLKGVVRRLNAPFGLRLTTESDVSPGCGLGASGAMMVACLAAMDAAMGTRRSRTATAALANEIERDDLGLSGGCQDSYAAACGGINFITIPTDGRVHCEPIPLSPASRFTLEQHLLLAHTGAVHLSSSIHDDIRADYALPQSATKDAMRKLSSIAVQMRAALLSGELEHFAALMSGNWTQHKRLHPSCEGVTLRRFHEQMAPYVAGAKTCGAGGGGCVALFAKEGQRNAIKAACHLVGADLLPFSIDDTGVQTWRVSSITPAPMTLSKGR